MTMTWVPAASRTRRILLYCLDILALALSLPGALFARFDFNTPESKWWGGMLAIFVVGAVAQALLGLAWGLYTGRWRRGSFEELSALAATSFCVLLVLLPANILPGERRLMPTGAVVGGTMAWFLVMAGIRYIWRALWERAMGRRGRGGDRVLIAGAGEAGRSVAQQMRLNPDFGMTPVAFLDDDPDARNLHHAGVRVLGTTEDMPRVVEVTKSDTLLIAIPSASKSTIERLTDLATAESLSVKTLPNLLELVTGTATLTDIRRVRLDDLLGRDPISSEIADVARSVEGKTVLVTGAGGSIGRELCRQVAAMGPGQLLMLDHDETSLHSLQFGLQNLPGRDSKHYLVANIRDQNRMQQIFRKWQPDIVYHAAAQKHLSIVELHPSEGVKTNISGTLTVARAALEAGAERFIFISTDKAAHPRSVLGATKRLGELIVQRLGTGSSTCFTAVRFGNVLGSRGSVISIFEQQIANGGPLTVTHPEVTRYFMTTEEACHLVIQAGTMARGGEVFVLDMGEPVKILDLARRMSRLSAPDRSIPIRFIGLRPGEKLHEDLFFSDEERHPSAHPKIFIGSTAHLEDAKLWEKVDALVVAAHINDDEVVRRMLIDTVRGYEPWKGNDKAKPGTDSPTQTTRPQPLGELG